MLGGAQQLAANIVARGERFWAAASSSDRFPTRWALWAQSRGEVSYVLCVELLTVVAVILTVPVTAAASGANWVRFAVLLGFASVHMFLSRRQEETRRNRILSVHVDLTSIWNFAAALILPLPLALLSIVAVRFQRWFVARRPLYRYVFGTSVITICLLGVHGVLVGTGVPVWLGIGSFTSMRDFLVAIAAGAVYVLGQIALIGVAVALHMKKPTFTAAVGTWYDNGLEAFTVALGMVTAVLVIRAPAVVAVMVLIGVIGNRLAEIRQLQVDVRTDPKTGLLNMRGWREDVTRELARADRTRAPAGVLMIDLDNFKQINDTWGHPAGDDMLEAVAGVLRAETRPADIVGRFGGEEFVVLLAETDPYAALAVAERVRARIAQLAVVTTDKRGGPALITERTTSIGVACRPMHAIGLTELLQSADEAVYGAKEAGRDRVRLADDRTPPSAPHQLAS